MNKLPEHCLAFANRAEWRAWRENHHAAEPEAWLLIRRKSSARQLPGLNEALEEAVCFGWIDSVLQPIDGETFALRFSPRKPGSNWSASNVQRAEKMIQAGQMTAAGLEKIAEAKENGKWEAALAREDVTSVPDDLVQALEAEAAWPAFEKLPASQKKLHLYGLASAKRPKTRQKRIQAIVSKLKKGPEDLLEQALD